MADEREINAYDDAIPTLTDKVGFIRNPTGPWQFNLMSMQDIVDLVKANSVFDYGGLYFSTPAATTISVSGTYYKAAGTTSISNVGAQMGMPADNRLQYTRAEPRHFHIVAQASVTLAGGTNQDIGLQIWHYDASAASGSLLAHSEARNTITSTAVQQITTHGDVMMDEDDYLEIHVANHTGTNNIQVDFGYLFAMGMITG